MTAWLGALGNLVQVRTPAVLRVSGARSRSFRTTLGGVRRMQVGPRVLRTWDVTLSATWSGDLATLAAFAGGEWGHGPHLWVDPWAQATNLLTPADGALKVAWGNTVQGGPVDLGPDGNAGRSLTVVNPAAVTYVGPPPVGVSMPCVPGVPVTASAWVQGAGGTFTVIVRDQAGDWLSSTTVTASGPDWQRVAGTVLPPAEAHYVTAQMVGVSRVTRPAFTWSPAVLPYLGGQGVQGVVVSEVPLSVLHTHTDPASARMALGSYQVTEVG